MPNDDKSMTRSSYTMDMSSINSCLRRIATIISHLKLNIFYCTEWLKKKSVFIGKNTKNFFVRKFDIIT